MANITRTYNSTSDVVTGATILAAHINTDVDKIYAEFNGSIDNSNIKASAAIAESKLSLPTRLYQAERQGGSATDWNTSGTTTRTVANPVVQSGTIVMGSQSFSSPVYYATANITFPTAYTNKPMVFVTMSNVSATAAFGAAVGSISTTGCTLTVNSLTDGYVAGSTVHWMAIGT